STERTQQIDCGSSRLRDYCDLDSVGKIGRTRSWSASRSNNAASNSLSSLSTVASRLVARIYHLFVLREPSDGLLLFGNLFPHCPHRTNQRHFIRIRQIRNFVVHRFPGTPSVL